jgi:lipopolysaccharide/colanic/teichoic acid biosynthesis glycosyltransferase
MAPVDGDRTRPSPTTARGMTVTYSTSAQSAVAPSFPGQAPALPRRSSSEAASRHTGTTRTGTAQTGTAAWELSKRAFDLVFCVTALLVLLPVLLLIALTIKLDSRGPVLFRQQRLGRGLRKFPVVKFRTMYQDVSPDAHRRYIEQLARADEAGDEGLKKLVNDPRVTRVGRVLRKLSLDELPQFFNVAAGQMSLIGPRPALDYELEHYQAHHFDRFEVRPGLSGLWQVSGRNRLGFMEMLELDAEYVRRYGPRTDVAIFVKTPVAVVTGCA